MQENSFFHGFCLARIGLSPKSPPRTIRRSFSDPKKYNDYYTFDYGKHKEVEYNSLKDFRQTSPLHFESTDGTRLEPLYNLHHCRYAVYLRKK